MMKATDKDGKYECTWTAEWWMAAHRACSRDFKQIYISDEGPRILLGQSKEANKATEVMRVEAATKKRKRREGKEREKMEKGREEGRKMEKGREGRAREKDLRG